VTTTKQSLLRTWGVRLFRATLLVSILALLRLQSDGGRGIEGTIELQDALPLFPTAFDLRAGPDLTAVLSEDSTPLGYAVKTLPISEDTIGYAGPSDVLIAFDEAGSVTGTELLWSGDTKEHADAVLVNTEFFDAFLGWTFGGENDPKQIDAVSGATLTSFAIIQSVALRLGEEQPSLKFSDPIAIADVERIFPEAFRLIDDDADPRFQTVLDESGLTLGRLIRTAPHSDGIMGYRGPSDGLVGLTPDGLVAGITLGATYENQRYADYVRDDDYFTERHQGERLEELAEMDRSRAWIEGVSGATMTSGALMEGVADRAQALLSAPPEPSSFHFRNLLKIRDFAALTAILLGCVLSFTRLRAMKSARLALHLYLVLILGLWAGDMVSLAVLGGWAKGAVPLKNAPGLVALVTAALALPWATGKPVYCQHLCPHGAAQTLLYRLIPGRVRLPGLLRRTLRIIPFLLLLTGVTIAAANLSTSLSALEAFDAWIIGVGGLASLSIALVGLIVSAYVPQAYCKYGCPTGLILEYTRLRRQENGLTRRDGLAVLLLAITLLLGFL
jgi:NosR/NirI family transcriptional regulator, nitrous oxide reductase regulator